MPTITLNYKKQGAGDIRVQRTDACFRMLGKNADYIKDLNKVVTVNLEPRKGYTLETLTLHDTELSSELEIFKLVRSTFSFMRTVNEPVKGQALEFNVKEYPFNEVLHALFWVRSFCRAPDCGEAPDNKSEQHLLMFREAGLPDWLALMSTGTALRNGSSLTNQGSVTPHYVFHYVEPGDGTVLSLQEVTTQQAVKALTGEYIRDDYGEHTLSSNIKYQRPYSPRVAAYAASNPDCHVDTSVQATSFLRSFWLKLMKLSADSTTVRVSSLGLTYYGSDVTKFTAALPQLKQHGQEAYSHALKSMKLDPVTFEVIKASKKRTSEKRTPKKRTAEAVAPPSTNVLNQTEGFNYA